MNNLIIYFVIAIVIFLIVAINMLLNPRTKKKGLFIVLAISVLVLIIYFYINYTFTGINFIEVSKSINSIIDDFIEGLIGLSIISSPIVLFLGLMIIIFAKAKRDIGLKIMVFAIIVFIIAMGVCLSTNYVRPFGGN